MQVDYSGIECKEYSLLRGPIVAEGGLEGMQPAMMPLMCPSASLVKHCIAVGISTTEQSCFWNGGNGGVFGFIEVILQTPWSASLVHAFDILSAGVFLLNEPIM